MLSLGQRLVPAELALAILEAWLTTPFDGGRHARRVAEIDDPDGQGGLSGRGAVIGAEG